MDNCAFCKIIRGELPCFKVYEDQYTLAILDLYPIKKGQTVVFPKIHTSSNFTEANRFLEHATMDGANESSKILQEKLGYGRSFVVVQGLGVDHFHIKIYPKYSDDKEKLTLYLPKHPEKKEVLEQIYNTLHA